MATRNLKVQWCLYSLQRRACTFKELGVSKITSVQSMMVLTFGYDFLKHSGKVAKIWPFEGQIIKYCNSWWQLDPCYPNSGNYYVLNLKARSSTIKPSLNLIIVIKSSCSNVSFLSDTSTDWNVYFIIFGWLQYHVGMLCT